MKETVVLIIVSCLLIVSQQCQGAMFSADLVDSKNSSNTVGTLEATVDGDEWTWSMDTTVPVTAVEIADRRGSATDPLFRPLVTLVDGEETKGMIDGAFGSNDVMTENAPDLYKNASIPAGKATAGHMCMGHIFAVANGTDGEVYTGAMTFMGEGNCYNATGTMAMGGKQHGGDMDMDMDMDMGAGSEAMDMGAGSSVASGSHMFGFTSPVKAATCVASAVMVIVACI